MPACVMLQVGIIRNRHINALFLIEQNVTALVFHNARSNRLVRASVRGIHVRHKPDDGTSLIGIGG